MSIFSDYAAKYHELGLSVIPIIPENKRPAVPDWSRYCEILPTEKEIELWSNKYPNYNIGVCLGPASGIIAFDFDYEHSDKSKLTLDQFNKDKSHVRDEILSYLPPSPSEKTGEKGFTKFYKYNGQKNKSLRRNGVALFDLLANGRQTVLPPSVHPSGMNYIWTAQSLEDCLDDLEILDQSVIDELEYILCTGSDDSTFKDTRHGKIFIHAGQVMPLCKDDDELIREMISYDRRINDIHYLTDKKHHKTVEAYGNAEKWLPRIKRHFAKKKIENKGKKLNPDDEYEVFNFFFEKHYSNQAKKCLLSEVVKYKNSKNKYKSVMNQATALKSYARTAKLNYTATEMHLSRWCEEKKEELLCEFDEWDNIDELTKFSDCLTVNNLTKDQTRYFLADFLIKTLKRANNNAAQNRCLVLKGPQGIGKDVFLETIGAGLDPYFSNIGISKNQKDNFEAIDGLLLANVPEIDQYKDTSVETFKDLITRNRAKFRRAYARDAEEKTLHASFCGSCNRDDFLRDSTGNRRFVIIDVESIDWSYTELNVSRLWAQVVSISNTWKRKPSMEVVMDQYILEHTPDNPEDLALETWHTLVREKWSIDQMMPERVPYSKVVDLLDRMHKLTGMKHRTCTSLLKRHKLYERIGGISAYFISKSKQEKLLKVVKVENHAHEVHNHAHVKDEVHGD